MFQLEKNLYEIQEQVNMLFPYITDILNPYNAYPRYLYHITDGTQYIDTHITPTLGTRIEMEFVPLSTENSFIVGSDKFAVYIKNGLYVFVVGNKLYTTNKPVIEQELVSIVLSKNGLTINGIAYGTSGNENFTSDKSILVGAAYDNSILNTYATLNSIDDIVDQYNENDDINEMNLMTTLNDIDDENTLYIGDLLADYGVNASSAKRIYSFKLSSLNEQNIREYQISLIPTRIIENGITIYCYYDMLNNEIYKGYNDTGFIKGAKDIVGNIAYDIMDIPEAQYKFILNNNGYYESTNKGVSNSYAICRVEFEMLKDNGLLQFDCINYAESNYDYGVFSNLDTSLTLSNNDDTSAELTYKSLKGNSMETVQTVLYYNIPKGNHFIDIKFRKDVSGNSYNDSLQFKLANPTGGVLSIVKPDSGSYTFTLNSSGYWESNNKAKANSYALCKVSFVMAKVGTVIFNCINYAESNYDYGILSKLDTVLSSSNSADSSTKVQKSFKGSSSSSIQQVVYNNVPIGEHYIYVKFRKDSSGNSNNDSLQFKVEIN